MSKSLCCHRFNKKRKLLHMFSEYLTGSFLQVEHDEWLSARWFGKPNVTGSLPSIRYLIYPSLRSWSRRSCQALAGLEKEQKPRIPHFPSMILGVENKISSLESLSFIVPLPRSNLLFGGLQRHIGSHDLTYVVPRYFTLDPSSVYISYVSASTLTASRCFLNSPSYYFCAWIHGSEVTDLGLSWVDFLGGAGYDGQPSNRHFSWRFLGIEK